MAFIDKLLLAPLGFVAGVLAWAGLGGRALAVQNLDI